MTPDPAPPQRLSAVELAQRAMEENHAILSTPLQQPLFLWTFKPFSAEDIKRAVEADGHAPYRLLCGWEDPRGLQVPGRPEGAKHAYLIVVEVLARIA